jgi:hypothetical protein
MGSVVSFAVGQLFAAIIFTIVLDGVFPSKTPTSVGKFIVIIQFDRLITLCRPVGRANYSVIRPAYGTVLNNNRG